MPRVSRQKVKGGVQTSPKNVAATVTSLRRGVEAHRAAHKQFLKRKKDKKSTSEAKVQLAIADTKLHEEKLDAEAVLRQAERSGMQTKALKDAIQSTADALSVFIEEPVQSDNAPIPPNPKSNPRASDRPNLATVDEGKEEEESTELSG